jgi:DNA-binding NarL/FixJ family response regulator
LLQLLAEARQVKEIAAILALSPKTVEFHKYRIMDLLGASHGRRPYPLCGEAQNCRITDGRRAHPRNFKP